DLARAQIERRALERADAGERLGEGAGFDQRQEKPGDARRARVTGVGLPYHASRRPNWAARPSSALVMVPTVAFEMFESGLPKLLWLRRLKISARNSRRAWLIGNRLLTEKFTCCVPGPRTVLRPALPCVPAAGTVYAVGSNHFCGV